MSRTKVKILVATHKPYDFPDSAIYVPVQVGKSLVQEDYGYLKDDSGENISAKNRSFSELTALYWAWKNRFFKESEFCGLVHYRRYFSGSAVFGKYHILSEKEIASILDDYDVIVPKKRKYYIETVGDHYAHAHYSKDLDVLKSILKERSPEYLNAFENIMEQTSLYLYNMFVMRTEDFNAYCAWLFPILFELEERIDISGYDTYQRRVFGFLSERLFTVWLLHHSMKTKEIKVVNTEGENLFLKAVKMLKRKYFK